MKQGENSLHPPQRHVALSAAAALGASAAPGSWRGATAADAADDASPETPPGKGKSHGFLHEISMNYGKNGKINGNYGRYGKSWDKSR